jgi:hypothetical protein
MNNTKIEWTDRTWNPVRGCSRISEGCRLTSYVVPGNKFARASATIEPEKHGPATTRTLDFEVVFSGKPAIKAHRPLKRPVMSNRRHNFKVFGPVIGLVFVLVVYLFSWLKQPSQSRLCNKSMFVDVSAHICAWMRWLLDEHIPIGCNRSAALPVGVS